MSIRSPKSDPICFLQDTSISLEGDITTQSNMITQDEYWDIPIKITVRKKLTDFDLNGPVMYVAYPYLITGQSIEDPALTSR